MAVLGLSAAAQGVDTWNYPATDGFTLTNKWIMNAGDGSNGIATAAWEALPFGNVGKATTAAMLDGKCYIACNQMAYQKPGVDEEGNPIVETVVDHLSHLIVLDAQTGAFVKDLKLMLDGVQHGDLLGINQIGRDDFGHLWVCGYVQNTYKEDGSTTPIKVYTVNTETGEMTLAAKLELDEVEGPGNGARCDCYDLIGDVTGKEARCVFMACCNEIAKTYTWHLNQGETEWLGAASDDADYVVVEAIDTDPAGQTAWNYSPMVSIVPDDEFSGELYYVDGHTTRPALYDHEGEMIESLASHQGIEEWEEFMPNQQANGCRQFNFAGNDFFAYALVFPDNSKLGGHVGLVKLDAEGSLENATPMWTFPGNPDMRLGIRKGEGRFHHSIVTGPTTTDANGKKAMDIMIMKDANGIAVYTLAEEGYQDGVESAIVDNNNAPVEYFNLNGVRVERANMTAGLYISRQGSKVEKVVIK